MEKYGVYLLAVAFCCAIAGFFVLISLVITEEKTNGRQKVTAVLQCTDCWNDLNVVTRCLLSNGLSIVKTKKGSSIYPKITVFAESVGHLTAAVKNVNAVSSYGVTVLKVKER